MWFPGEFRAITDAPLHMRGDTIVVRAMHKVTPMLDIISDMIMTAWVSNTMSHT